MSSEKTFANAAPGAEGVDPNHPAEQGYGFEITDAEQAMVRPLGLVRKKIAICGFAASSRLLAPFDDPAVEVWSLNQLYRHIPRASRHFDVHRNWASENVPGTDHPAWLAQCGIPVYMVECIPSIPTSIRYPIERVIDKVVGVDYETSTVAFMVALAIHEIDNQVEAEIAAASNGSGATHDDAGNRLSGHGLDYGKARAWIKDRYAEREISLWGIDLIVGTEYEYQKPCVEYMLGLAHARGIVVRLPPASALLKQLWRYGYQAEPEQWPIKLSEINKRGAALTNEKNTLIARLQTIDGALQEASYWQQIADLRSKGGQVKLNEATSS